MNKTADIPTEENGLSLMNSPMILVTHAAMISLATLIVYLSSKATLEKPRDAAEPDRDSELFHPSDLEYSQVEERVSTSEAYLMPVFGAAGLLSLYFAFKYLDADMVQTLLKYYFMFVAFLSISSTSSLVVKGVLRTVFNKAVPRNLVTLSKDANYEANIDKPSDVKKESIVSTMAVDVLDLLTIPLGGVVTVAHALWFDRSWVLGNFIGGCLAITGIKTIRLGSFKVGMIAFAGLFLYDIYFVFGTDVMMTVATKVEAPIKLEIPRPAKYEDEARPMSMLGLGDIVVPAMVLSLCLRFDAWRFYKTQPKLPFHLKRPFDKTYFHAAILAYAAGLVVTIVVMQVFKAGQPALLYLCPAIAGTILAVAWKRNELELFWSYDESIEDDNKDDKKTK